MSDLISRQAAIDEVRNYYDPEDTSVTSIEDRIKRLPSAQPKTQLSTEDATFDCISRQAAIDEIDEWIKAFRENGHKESAADACLIQDGIIQLPSAQPDMSEYSDKLWKKAYERGRAEAQAKIVRCKDCVKHNKGHGYYYDGTVIGIKDCCPLVEIRGIAQGHEFDYQYCAYAERRTDDSISD